MIRTCRVCGKEFKKCPSVIKKGWGNTCSWECREKHYDSKRKGHKGEIIKRNCLICGKPLETIPCRVKQGKVKFCSRECLGKWNSGNGKNQYAKGENSPFWQGRTEKKCLTCGKEIKVRPTEIKKRGKFCSHSCCAMYNINRRVFICKNKHTSIELKVEDYLKELGIQYESQKVIPEGRTVADFYIPSQRLVVYADGTYWHSPMRVKELNQTQDFLLGFNNYKILRLSEKEINDNPKEWKGKINKEIYGERKV